MALTPEKNKKNEESSQAFKAAARPLVEKILKDLNLPASIKQDGCISHHVESEPCTVHGAAVVVQVCQYARMGGGMSDNINVEVTISLPKDGVLAQSFMDHVAAEEHIKKNHGGKYAAGPRYCDYLRELSGKRVEAYSPWNNTYLVVQAKNYTISQMEEAVRDLLVLARPMVEHLCDLTKLRFWTTDDEKVKAKAREIIKNADFRDDHVDYETRSHWMEDGNSFFRGWFNPWNDRGRGTFDTLWPSSVDYAASAMGIKGSFEYAVACILLDNNEFIAKARQACVIREETKTIRY